MTVYIFQVLSILKMPASVQPTVNTQDTAPSSLNVLYLFAFFVYSHHNPKVRKQSKWKIIAFENKESHESFP